jgi:uncharacterized membrane-anchored protein
MAKLRPVVPRLVNGAQALQRPSCVRSSWIIKIMATTVGETGGGFLNMQLDSGLGTMLVSSAFVVGVVIYLNRARARGHGRIYDRNPARLGA